MRRYPDVRILSILTRISNDERKDEDMS